MDKSKLIIETGEELQKRSRGEQLEKDMLEHFRRFHSMNEIYDRDIEKYILDYELNNMEHPKRLHFEHGLVTFSPSSASKCERELYYKAIREKQDEQPMEPYQRRWVRNGSAIHMATQKDLLLAEQHLNNPAFTVEKMPDGSPAWERSLKDVKQMKYKGVRFQVFGMMDGILRYKDGSRIGFEFKTKSTTIGSIGHFRMKDAQEGHKQQAIAYSLLFGINEFVFVYESLAKDSWMKGKEAKPDMRAFYFKPTNEQKRALLDKFARVATMVRDHELPAAEFPEKCIFCPFKTACERDHGYSTQAVERAKAKREEERKERAEKRRRARAAVRQ